MTSPSDVMAALRVAVGGAVNIASSTKVGAVAVTERRFAVGSQLKLAGTTDIHAETAAVTAAQRLSDGPVHALWLARSGGGHITPCGACRQSLWDLSVWQRRNIDVISVDLTDESRRSWRLADLLPDAFVSRTLTDRRAP